MRGTGLRPASATFEKRKERNMAGTIDTFLAGSASGTDIIAAIGQQSTFRWELWHHGCFVPYRFASLEPSQVVVQKRCQSCLLIDIGSPEMKWKGDSPEKHLQHMSRVLACVRCIQVAGLRNSIQHGPAVPGTSPAFPCMGTTHKRKPKRKHMMCWRLSTQINFGLESTRSTVAIPYALLFCWKMCVSCLTWSEFMQWWPTACKGKGIHLKRLLTSHVLSAAWQPISFMLTSVFPGLLLIIFMWSPTACRWGTCRGCPAKSPAPHTPFCASLTFPLRGCGNADSNAYAVPGASAATYFRLLFECSVAISRPGRQQQMKRTSFCDVFQAVPGTSLASLCGSGDIAYLTPPFDFFGKVPKIRIFGPLLTWHVENCAKSPAYLTRWKSRQVPCLPDTLKIAPSPLLTWHVENRAKSPAYLTRSKIALSPTLTWHVKNGAKSDAYLTRQKWC